MGTVSYRRVLHSITGPALAPVYSYRWWALDGDGCPIVTDALTVDAAKAAAQKILGFPVGPG